MARRRSTFFAIDPVTGDRYHIETTVSISQNYRALTTKEYVDGDHKVRGKAARARRTLGFFLKQKFDAPGVQQTIAQYCNGGPHRKIIVIWEWNEGVKEAAAAHGIQLWDFRDLMREIAELGRHQRTYFGGDTLRTLTLFVKALDSGRKAPAKRYGS